MSWLWGSKQKRKKTDSKKNDSKKPSLLPSQNSSLLDKIDQCYEEIELMDDSRLFGPEDPKKLSEFLPARVYGCKWKMVYSTFCHGISSSTLFRASRECGGPNILIIKDFMGYVFGAFASHPWDNPEPKFYGNGECFLFTLHPEFRIYKWSNKNCYCQMIENNRIIMGGGSGVFGLWLDEDLLSGTTQPCETFENPVLSSDDHFKVFGLELWSFHDGS